ncbi:MAG: hypothetical protein MI674_06455 [Cytophagales bacterium]|nr:hypothetical protein [Cytophagales bacterium]
MKANKYFIVSVDLLTGTNLRNKILALKLHIAPQSAGYSFYQKITPLFLKVAINI